MSTEIPRQTSRLLGARGWFEDFTVGQQIRHARASTIDEIEGSFIAKQVMNTAQAHFNDEVETGMGSGRVVFGLATASMVLGLSAQDCTEHAIAELGCDKFRFRSPVHHGDTISAYSEVLSVADSPDHQDVGVVTFKHWGVRQDDVIVFEGERTVLIKRQSHWR